MGKSAVLKDSSNRPAGYMRAAGDCIICRVQLETPAELALVFADGSWRTYALSGGHEEQRFSDGKGEIIGCCVFAADELLLVSDESMRCVFSERIARKRTAHADEIRKRQTPAQQDERKTEQERKGNAQHVFAQRRWPPPPCWESAQYKNGSWQEE
ncbi:MAG: hypothetical protein IJ418_23440 [Clostridia bacterium]|nr:hypothetical protein [Clostridia bacterium]